MSVSVRFSQRVERCGASMINVLMAKALAQPELISLAAGFVDSESLPVAEVHAALQELIADANRAKAALQYGSTIGLPELRTQLVQHLQRQEVQAGGKLPDYVQADRMVIGTGSQQLLYLLGEILCNPGDIVLLGVPAYFVYTGVLESLGIEARAVATDEDGLIPEDLEQQLRQLDQDGLLERVKLIYDVSYYNNPTGLTLSRSRRPQVVALAQQWSQKYGPIFLLEDAAYRELQYRGEPLPSLLQFDPTGETVIYTSTFSKPFAPGLRVGYMILPEPLVAPLVTHKGHHDFGSANLNQYLAHQVLVSGLYQSHLTQLQAVYREKLDATLAVMAKEFAGTEDLVQWTKPDGGLYVWLKLPAEISTAHTGELFQICLDAGVLYVPGLVCYPSSMKARPDSEIRLSFGVQSIPQIEEGVRRLAKAVTQLLETVPANS